MVILYLSLSPVSYLFYIKLILTTSSILVLVFWDQAFAMESWKLVFSPSLSPLFFLGTWYCNFFKMTHSIFLFMQFMLMQYKPAYICLSWGLQFLRMVIGLKYCQFCWAAINTSLNLIHKGDAIIVTLFSSTYCFLRATWKV